MMVQANGLKGWASLLQDKVRGLEGDRKKGAKTIVNRQLEERLHYYLVINFSSYEPDLFSLYLISRAARSTNRRGCINV